MFDIEPTGEEPDGTRACPDGQHVWYEAERDHERIRKECMACDCFVVMVPWMPLELEYNPYPRED